jgi:uncharacterized protein YfaS (alpha-2-macroglobulin family)
LRPNKGIYRVGDSMRIEVYASTRTGGTVFVDIVKNNQTILTHTVRLDRENTITVPVDQSLAGTLALNGYIIRSDGNMIRDTRQVIVTRSDDLHIDIQPNLDEYLPGQPASIKIAVTDPDGNPVQAALGMNIVDESVYSLAEKEPGLAKVFFAIEKELLDPKIEIHGFQMDKVVRLSAKKYQESNTLSKALLAKLDTLSEFGLNIDTAQQKVQKIQQDFNAIRNALSRTPFAYDGNPLTVEEMLVRLEVSLQDVPVLDPWNNPYMIFAENDQIQVASMGRDMELNTGDDIKREGVIYTRKAGSKSEGRDLFRGISEKNYRFIAKGVNAIPELWFDQPQLPNEPQQQNQHHLYFSYGQPVERRLGVRPMMMRGTRGQEIALGALGGGMMEIQEGMVMEDMAAVNAPVDALAMDGFAGVVVGDHFGLDEAEKLSSLKLELDFNGDGFLTETIEKYEFLSNDDGKPILVDGELDQEALRNAVLDKLKDEIGEIAILQPREEKPKQEKVRVRTYFPETLFYTPEFITDAKGEATLSLAMADSITTWRMTAMANAKSGAIGDTTSAMKVFKPFFIDLDLPVALIQSDEVTIPVAIYNYLPTAQTIDIQLEDKPWYTLLEGERKRHVHVAANEVSSVTYRIKANELGKQPITVYAYGSEDSDAIGRHIDVRPNGDPRFVTHNGSLRQPVRADVDFPQDRVEGADKLFVKIYPGLFSQIVEGLDAILQMPYGCFEQTSSTTYPNVLALNYMRETGRVTPAIEMKALEYINLGYQRLLTFEIDGGGFQVFGNPPATRILSAYGLLEFSDMAAVYPIDPQVIERTQRWLIQQMRPDGSWAPDENYAHAEMWKSIQDNNLLVTAYIALALAKSGQQAGMDAPKNYLLQHAAEADDAYTLSILANALLAIAPDSDTTRNTLGKLVDMGVIEGDYLYWKSEASMSFARGNHANVETTAWAALALIESENYPQELGKALNWIISQKDPNGTWGTTHGTVLALKALIKSLKSRTERSTATVTITVNGTKAQKIEITPENSDLFRTIDVTKHAKDANRVELGFEGKGNLLYQVVGKYYTPWNAHIPRIVPFEIKVEYDRANLRRNDTVTCQVTAKNTTNYRAEMVMIDVGVPPGFRVEQPALDDYVKKGVIEKCTIMSRQVLIYLESMDGKQEIKLDIPMKATLPIVAKAPETSIYEYYNPEVKKIDQPQDIIVE